MTKKRFLLLEVVVIAIAAGSLYWFNFRSVEESEPENVIATTIQPLAMITDEIAGDKFNVVSILPAGASPHTFEPKVSTTSQMADAQAVFKIGYGIDDWVDDLAGDSQKMVTVDKYVEFIEGESHEHSHDLEDEHAGEEHAEETHSDEISKSDADLNTDPHYWLSTANGAAIALQIYESLAEIDPENSDYYLTNYEAFKQEMSDLQAELNNLRSESVADLEIITFHDAFGYLVNEFDFEIVGVIEPYAGKEPTAAYLNEIVAEIETYNIENIFAESQLSPVVVKALSEDYNLKVGELDPLGGVSGRETFSDLIGYNVRTIINTVSE